MTERKQPTIPELIVLLEHCQNPPQDGPRLAWNERVSALREAFDMRTQWHNGDNVLRGDIHTYLIRAGA